MKNKFEWFVWFLIIWQLIALLTMSASSWNNPAYTIVYAEILGLELVILGTFTLSIAWMINYAYKKNKNDNRRD